MKIAYTFLMISSCAFYLASCKKSTEVPPPRALVTEQQVFSNLRDATRAMLGVYISTMDNKWSMINGGLSIFCSMSADDLYRTQRLEPEDEFLTNSLTSQNYICASFYNVTYDLIYQSNTIIRNMQSNQHIDSASRRQLMGEACFFRALCYYYLVNLYGDIPLVTSSDFHVTTTLPRAPVDSVYSQVIADLEQACAFLPDNYPGDSAYAIYRTRPNRASSMALLATVYCTKADWSRAEVCATALIADPAYRLETNLDDVLRKESTEVIWQLQPVRDKTNTAEGSFFIPRQGAAPVYTMTEGLFKSFESNDQRLVHWTNHTPDQLYYPYKYRQAANKPAGVEYNVILRLAEQYLIRAEARAMQNDVAGAIDDLLVVRQRAGLTSIAPNEHMDILHTIWHERQVELFAECGHRWIDLRRTGRIDTVLRSEKTGWQPSKAWYPIPASQLQNNPNLIQTKGY